MIPNKMKITLCCCEQTLLSEIENPHKMTKQCVAQTYRLALDSGEKVDWAKVNKAIIKRWSMSALRDIKGWAWSGKCFKDYPGNPGR